jgi:hypothetical protein
MSEPEQKADTIGHAAPQSPDDDTDGLSVQERRFVTLSALGESMDVMAATLGVTSRTLRRWKLRPVVASAISDLTHESMAMAKSTLANAASRAARELVGLAESASPDASRVSAARAILEHAEKFVEVAELVEQVAEIRATLSALPANRFPRR